MTARNKPGMPEHAWVEGTEGWARQPGEEVPEGFEGHAILDFAYVRGPFELWIYDERFTADDIAAALRGERVQRGAVVIERESGDGQRIRINTRSGIALAESGNVGKLIDWKS